MGRQRRLALAGFGAAVLALVLAGSAGAASSIRYRVGLPTTIPDHGQTSLQVACPKGTHVLSGGQIVDIDPGTAVLVSSAPFDGADRDRAPDDGWRSSVKSFAPGATMTVTAICGRSEPRYVSRSIQLGGLVVNTGRAACPRGTRAIGGGMRIPVGFGAGGSLWESGPFDGNDVGSLPDDGWEAKGVVENKATKATITAICRRGKLRYGFSTNLTPPNSGDEYLAPCPGQTGLIGGGMTIAGGGGNLFATTGPIDGIDADTAPDDFWDVSYFNLNVLFPGLITVYAICRP